MRLRVARRRRAAVVPVRDVRDGNAREELLELVAPAARARGDLPDRVADAVRRDEVVERGGAAGVGDDRVDRLVVAVGEERRTRVRLKRLDVARAVVFLVLARLLVLLEDAREVVLRVEARHDARLRMGPHRLAVGVVLRLRVLDKRAVRPQRVKRAARLRIGLRRRAGRTVGQVDLGTRDVQKALRIARGQGLRLGRVHHIIRNGRDQGRVRRIRPDGRKGMNLHRSSQKPMLTIGQKAISPSRMTLTRPNWKP